MYDLTSYTKEKDITALFFIYKGYLCMIARQALTLHLCGYVGVDKDHPAYNKCYMDLDSELDVFIHGGLTYSDFFFEKSTEEDMFQGFAPLYFIGFDCAHIGDDVLPGWIEYEKNKPFPRLFNNTGTYKDIAFVMEECKKLADELIRMEKIE